MSVHRPIALALLLGIAAGCNSSEPDIPRENYALIFTDAKSVAGGGYVTLPVANFVNTTQLLFETSTNPADACIETTYDPTQGGTNLGNIEYLNPGTVSAETDDASRPLSLVIDDETDSETWEITGTSGLPYVPGDTITFAGTGNAQGFPLFAISARTAEAFTFTEPAVPNAGQPIALAWTATGIPAGSAMLVSLRYRSSVATGEGPDRQIFCEMIDDGAFNVPASLTTGWRAATVRETAMSRWRTEFEQITANSFAVVSSNFTVPTEGAGPTFRQAATGLLSARR